MWMNSSSGLTSDSVQSLQLAFNFHQESPPSSASGRFQERFQRFKLHGTEFHLCREDSSFPDFLIPFLFFLFLKKKGKCASQLRDPVRLLVAISATSDWIECHVSGWWRRLLLFVSKKKRGESGSMARQWEEIKIPQEIGVEWEKKELSSRRLFRVFSF